MHDVAVNPINVHERSVGRGARGRVDHFDSSFLQIAEQLFLQRGEPVGPDRADEQGRLAQLGGKLAGLAQHVQAKGVAVALPVLEQFFLPLRWLQT